MKFSAADQLAMITATGEAVTIGSTAAVGKFKAAGKIVQLYDGSIQTTGPLLLLTEVSAALVTENSTVIAVRGVNYQATQKLPDDAGFVELELTKDY